MRNSLRHAITAILLLGIVCLRAMADDVVASWKHQAWINPWKAFVIAFEATDAAHTHTLRYTLPDGIDGSAKCERPNDSASSLTASIGPLNKNWTGPFVFWVERRLDTGKIIPSDRRTISFSQQTEIEVSGQTGDELEYPLEDWKAEILFKPCCYIPSGWLTAERVPVSPTGTNAGLPATLLSSFFTISPDDMVKATGGVNVRIYLDKEALKKLNGADVAAYYWKDTAWRPLIEPTMDLKRGIVTLLFPDGGHCVIAGANPPATQ